ncbi:hypothetical protein TKK_0007696 [Trichogramma kaykai]|uniref:MADF domain-containing protein n=1 Tax=Trichogramma kaykai TaxID=54128 RepID=A0ABD2X843_9HYME
MGRRKKNLPESLSVDQETHLIAEVRKNPELWNIKHELYYNTHAKGKLWELVSAEIGCTKEIAQDSWISLKSKYKREAAKIKLPASGSGAADVHCNSNWIHFESLRFLSDSALPQQTVSNLDDLLENTSECSTYDQPNTEEQEEIFEMPLPKEYPEPNKNSNYNNSQVEKYFEAINQHVAHVPEHEKLKLWTEINSVVHQFAYPKPPTPPPPPPPPPTPPPMQSPMQQPMQPPSQPYYGMYHPHYGYALYPNDPNMASAYYPPGHLAMPIKAEPSRKRRSTQCKSNQQQTVSPPDATPPVAEDDDDCDIVDEKTFVKLSTFNRPIKQEPPDEENSETKRTKLTKKSTPGEHENEKAKGQHKVNSSDTRLPLKNIENIETILENDSFMKKLADEIAKKLMSQIPREMKEDDQEVEKASKDEAKSSKDKEESSKEIEKSLKEDEKSGNDSDPTDSESNLSEEDV